jgi:hypothetical protein
MKMKCRFGKTNLLPVMTMFLAHTRQHVRLPTHTHTHTRMYPHTRTHTHPHTRTVKRLYLRRCNRASSSTGLDEAVAVVVAVAVAVAVAEPA